MDELCRCSDSGDIDGIRSWRCGLWVEAIAAGQGSEKGERCDDVEEKSWERPAFANECECEDADGEE